MKRPDWSVIGHTVLVWAAVALVVPVYGLVTALVWRALMFVVTGETP